MTWLMRRLSPLTTSTSPFAESVTSTSSFSARSRTITIPRSSASRSENGATSSSTWPASTLARSRMSLISASRWLAGGQDVFEVFLLLLVDLTEHPFAQHLREPDDRVQRRPQLVRHVGEKLRLVPARRLELAALQVKLRERRGELSGSLLDLLLEAAIGLLELRRHAIELVGERAQLVIARNLDPLVERTGADPRRRSLDRLDRPHQPASEQNACRNGQQRGRRPAVERCARSRT